MFGVGVGVRVGGFTASGGVAPYVGLLDTYPNAAAAYSVRLLKSDYTGNAIRVRRSSDNAEQNIGFVSGNLDTTSLTSFCSGTNGFVTTWYDQSGNGRNATQTTATNQPVIVTAGVVNLVNLKPAVYFNNGNTTSMAFSQLTLNNFTILWVTKKLTNVGTQSIILSNGGQYSGDGVDNDGTPMMYTTGSIITIPQGNTTAQAVGRTNQHLSYLNRRNSTQAVGQFNNSNNSYNNSVPSSSFTPNGIANYGSNYNWVGDMQEIVIYGSDKSSDRTGISTEINTYYGIY
jgi:hypothetical protein